MRNEALLFALKQQRDGAGGEPVARGVSIGTGSNKRSHASGSDPCPPGHHKNTRSTADVGVQMVHSQVFALDAIIQCKLADDERAQNLNICSVCGGTAEEALEGELTLALGLGGQRIQHRTHSPEALGKRSGSTEGECEAARMQLSEMRGELQQLHTSLRGSLHNLKGATHNSHAWEQRPAALLLADAAEESLEHDGAACVGGDVAGVAAGAPLYDSGATSLLRIVQSLNIVPVGHFVLGVGGICVGYLGTTTIKRVLS